jgi:hypothetical protein
MGFVGNSLLSMSLFSMISQCLCNTDFIPCYLGSKVVVTFLFLKWHSLFTLVSRFHRFNNKTFDLYHLNINEHKKVILVTYKAVIFPLYVAILVLLLLFGWFSGRKCKNQSKYSLQNLHWAKAFDWLRLGFTPKGHFLLQLGHMASM